MTNMLIELDNELSTKISSMESQASICTDAPKVYGGKGEDFSPTDLIAAALGACVVTVMAIYAKQHNLTFSGVKAQVQKAPKVVPGGIGDIRVDVYIPHHFDESTRVKLESTAQNCPVHKVLDSKVKQEIVIHWGESYR